MWSLLYSRPDGTFVIELNGMPYHVVQSDPLFDDVQQEALLSPPPLEPPPPVATPTRPALDPLDFRRRFTMLERARITAAAEQAMRSTPPDPTLRVILDDLGAAKTVYLDDPEVVQAVDVFIGLGLVAPERKAEILAWP